MTVVSEFSHVFSFCWDMEGEIVFTNYLKEVLSLDSWSCGSVPDHCSMSNSTLVRWACANTCGCDNPLSSLYLNSAAYGCHSGVVQGASKVQDRARGHRVFDLRRAATPELDELSSKQECLHDRVRHRRRGNDERTDDEWM